jgi:hypothetical protein
LKYLVPNGARRISLSLTATVKQLSTGTSVSLSQSKDFSLNGIDAADAIGDFHLKFTKEGYQILCLGKTGEPKAHTVLSLAIKSRWQGYVFIVFLEYLFLSYFKALLFCFLF